MTFKEQLEMLLLQMFEVLEVPPTRKQMSVSIVLKGDIIRRIEVASTDPGSLTPIYKYISEEELSEI